MSHNIFKTSLVALSLIVFISISEYVRGFFLVPSFEFSFSYTVLQGQYAMLSLN